MVIEDNAKHPEKAKEPIEVIRVPPMVSDVIVVLPFNIFAGIEVAVAPVDGPRIVILLAIFWNTLLLAAMVIVFVGSVIDDNDEQF